MQLAERAFRRKGYVRTSNYGMRKHPITHKWAIHNGVDEATTGKTNEEKKWKLYALESGLVVSAGIDSKGANAIFAWVYYKRLGIRVLYYHMDKVYVKKGQYVDENTVVGLTGTTGNSSGIHLHMGVKKLINGSWKYIDPDMIDYQLDESITVNGILDKQTIKELQRRCGTKVDGVLSNPSSLIKEIQRRLISGEKI